MDERWHDPQAGRCSVYIRTGLAVDELTGLFRRVGELGFGRDANLGRGGFDVAEATADPRLFEHRGNRLLSLSRGVLTPSMTAARYKLHTHYGKVGGLYAGSARPFKRPLSLIQPGATFAPGDGGPYGALLAGVHPSRPGVVHRP